ncbi:MAG: hypothetical protein IPP66_16045 [Anaerolineales bacterium]|nr:hypothetical protein [Anaerolineales bacterium]
MAEANEEHREYLLTVQNQVVDVCEAILCGETSVLLGARTLSRLHYELFKQIDDDFVLFIGIDSETDNLPIGDERKYWNEKVLVEKDKEIAEYEARVGHEVFDACQKLINRFSSR